MQIITGFGVLILWILLLATDQVAELDTTPYSILTHITAETLMALLLILSGILELREKKGAALLSLFALGTLAYSVINSSGYYLDRAEPAMPLMFLVLLILALLRLKTLINGNPPR